MENNRLDLKSVGTRQEEARKRTILSGVEYLDHPPKELETGKYLLQGENGQCFYLTDKLLSMGLLLQGSSGCGKTNTLFQLLSKIIPQMTEKDVMILFDSKGDFARKYFIPNNPKHVLVSLNKRDAAIARPWNVFRELPDEDGELSNDFIDVRTGEISRGLIKGLESETQPFFHTAAADIAAKLLSASVKDAISSKDILQLSNKAFSEMLSRSDNKELLALTGKYPNYKYLKSYVGDGRSNQALGVYGYLMGMKERNFVGAFNQADPGHGFGIRELVRKRGGTIVFLEYSVEYSETLSSIYSLMFDLAIKEALSSPGGNKFFICDEASLLPYIQTLGELLNVGRSYGCKTIFAIQSYAQLKKNYGEDQAAALAAGFCSMFAYQNTDYESRNYVKQRCGEVLEAYTYAGQVVTHDSFTIRDSDQHGLQTGEAFIDIKNSTPFRFKFKEV